MKVFLIDFDLIVHRHQTTPSKDSNVTPNYPSARFLIRLDSLSQKPKTYSHRLVIFPTILFALDQSKEAQTLEVEAVYPSGGSKKGARGDRRLLIFKSNCGPKGQKNVFWDRRPPYLRVWMTGFPPPHLKVWSATVSRIPITWNTAALEAWQFLARLST